MNDPPSAVQYSPDGRWWWNGQQWVPVLEVSLREPKAARLAFIFAGLISIIEAFAVGALGTILIVFAGDLFRRSSPDFRLSHQIAGAILIAGAVILFFASLAAITRVRFGGFVLALLNALLAIGIVFFSIATDPNSLGATLNNAFYVAFPVTVVTLVIYGWRRVAAVGSGTFP